MVMTKHATFITDPTFIISNVVMPEGSNAIALGGVDTGNMKEKEVTSVGGNIKYNGLLSPLQHKGAMIGSKILAEATLEDT